MSLDYYRRASAEIFKILKSHCKKLQRASIDEAYLDLSDDVQERMKSLELPLDLQWNDSYGILVAASEGDDRLISRCVAFARVMGEV